MNRARLASVLGFLCGILFACSLIMQWMRDPSHLLPGPGLYPEWSVCVALFAGSLGLWFQKRWGRLTVLIAGVLFLVLCTGILVGVGCAASMLSCSRLNVLSQPTLAVSFYFAKVACSVESIQCYETSVCVQPILTILTMTVLLKPLASNNRSKGRDA
jgi:hypothetical protein